MRLQELKEDVRKFRSEWETSGPMVRGISPLEAVERLRRFKEEMQLRERKVGQTSPCKYGKINHCYNYRWEEEGTEC